MTEQVPKSMVDIGNGRLLLEEQLTRLGHSGLATKAYIVTGYMAEKIEDWSENRWDGILPIVTCYNPFFTVSDNLLSLWLARDQMNCDFLVTNGDNLFDTSVFSKLASIDGQGIFLTICRKDSYEPEDMKVTLENGTIKRVSKQIPVQDASAVSVGLALIAGNESQYRFREALTTLARSNEAVRQYWLEVINALVSCGVSVGTVEIDYEEWNEVDYPHDLRDVRSRIRGQL